VGSSGPRPARDLRDCADSLVMAIPDQWARVILAGQPGGVRDRRGRRHDIREGELVRPDTEFAAWPGAYLITMTISI
jgi:hypothetical protein